MKQDLPNVGDLVVVTIREVKNFGAKASLEEYKDREGFIHIAEVARGWVKHIRDYLREGQKTVCKVLSVDQARGYVDLSLKRVNPHQKREKISEWKNDQKADKLLEIVASSAHMSVEQAQKEFAITLADRFGSLYRAFEEAAMEPEWAPDLNGDWKKPFEKVAKENVAPSSVKIGGFVEMYSLSSNGIERIKEVLSLATNAGISIQYAGAPRYRLQIVDTNYKSAEDKLKSALVDMEGEAKKQGISFEFNRSPAK